MATHYTWKLNGVDLDTATGHLAAVTQSRPVISTRRNPIIIPGLHGTLNPGLPIFDEPTITIGISRAGTFAEIEQALDTLAALLAQPTLTLTRVTSEREVSAAAKLVSADMDSDFVAGAFSAPVAVLAIPGTFFRAAAWTSADLAFSADLTMAELSGLSGSTAPIGDATIRITGPATSVTVTDPTTGTGITWTGSLAAGQYLFMRPRPLSARISSLSSEWTSGGTDVSTGLDFPAAGRLQLWPVVQSATVRKVLINAGGGGRTAATKLAVQAQGAYL